MKTPEDLELELLLKELAPTDALRAQLLEEHRQLEKDLLRLADPMPPADFVHAVMAKVATAPARAPKILKIERARGSSRMGLSSTTARCPRTCPYRPVMGIAR